MKKAWGNIDWLEVTIPPLPDEDPDGMYTIRVHMNFMLSNWECIFGRGCTGLFGIQEPHYNDDAGCCVHSFWFSDKEDYDEVAARVEQLTDEDWDSELREHVAKNGWANIYNADEDEFNGKGKVFEGACVFQNRNGGSTGKPGCAFHWLSQRTGETHVDTMPNVCWQLPIRFKQTDSMDYVLSPWDADEWGPAVMDGTHNHHCAWWCIDSPEAYVGQNPVYKTLETELRATLGDREYEIVVEAIEAKLAEGNKYANMPGASVNNGRPLLPLIVGNRTPRREPSYYPEFLERLKQENDG